jgi:hypothetical protein
MAIVVLVLWLFTAGVGLSLLVTSSLARARPAESTTAEPATAEPATTEPAAPVPASAAPAATSAAHGSRRGARGRFDTPSLVAARNAPIVPGVRSLLEFAHPACALAGLAFWLGFTMVHNRSLGWIAFGLLAVTACAGLTWFTANARTEPKPSFSPRLAVLHGGAAAVTVALAALTALAILLRSTRKRPVHPAALHGLGETG